MASLTFLKSCQTQSTARRVPQMQQTILILSLLPMAALAQPR